jgi:hypothetical protein
MTLGYNNVQFNSTDPIPEASIDTTFEQMVTQQQSI